uniref:Putative pentatricopeptide repeat protein n=1 Tax=Helianthus annuus TaxID=4232 RepID=A0A251UEP8_HELAN
MTLIVKMKQYSTALSLFKRVNMMGIPTDLYAINISINCHCRLNQVPYGFALLATLFKQGYSHNQVTYNTLINGLVLADRVFEAVELFKKLLIEKLCDPDQFMYGSVINVIRVYCQEGLLGKGTELLRKMEVNGCLPDSFTYNVIVRELLKKNEPGEAEILLEEMINRGFMPDHATFENLLVRIPNVGKDSRLRTIVLKLTSVERKDGGMPNITSSC